MREYDLVFLTNTPSFYKINLCNQISSRLKLLVVFYGYGDEAVNTHLDSEEVRFHYEFLHHGDAHKRSKMSTLIKLLTLMKKIRCKKVLYSGWFVLEYNLYALISPRYKNAIVCESSPFETSFAGIKGWIKKKIVKRMSVALPSGEPHKRIFKTLGFKGKVITTGGVGIFNYGNKTVRAAANNSTLRFLYVGRLVQVKNLELLIEVFNKNGLPLTIVGSGVLRDKLRSIANENIVFTDFVANEKLGEIYQANDVFILPSKSEPWGLVVEEALYWGLPVIVSDKVGASEDMVVNLKTGLIFRFDSPTDLQMKIDEMICNFQKFKDEVDKVDFTVRDKRQIKAYIELI